MFYRSSHLLLEITFSFHGDGAEHLELASQNISTVNCDCFLGAIGKDHKLTRYDTRPPLPQHCTTQHITIAGR